MANGIVIIPGLPPTEDTILEMSRLFTWTPLMTPEDIERFNQHPSSLSSEGQGGTWKWKIVNGVEPNHWIVDGIFPLNIQIKHIHYLI